MATTVPLNSTSVRLRINLGVTGLLYNTAGLIISTICDNEATATAYTVTGSTIEDITTLGTYAAPTSTKVRFKSVDATNHYGLCEIHLADARFAVASSKRLVISFSGATLPTAGVHYEVILAGYASETNITAGTITTVTTTTTATNVTTVNGLAAGVITSGVFAADSITGSAIAADAIAARQLAASAVTEIATGIWTDTTASDFTVALSVGKSVMNGVTLGTGLTVARCTLTDTLTTYTSNTVQTGDSYAIVNSGTHGNAAIKGYVDDIGVAGAGLSAIPGIAAVYLATGTVVSTTGTTTTLDAGAVATTDYHTSADLVITAGTGAGQERIITGYTSGRVATHAAWATNPTAASTYQIRVGRSSATGGDATLANQAIIISRLTNVTIRSLGPPIVNGRLRLVANKDYLIANDNSILIPLDGVVGLATADDALLTIRNVTSLDVVLLRLAATSIDTINETATFEIPSASLDYPFSTPISALYEYSIELKHGTLYQEVAKGPHTLLDDVTVGI